MGTYLPPLPPQNFLPKQTVVTSAWLNQIDSILQGRVPADGVYQPAFVSGQVQLTGPNGYITSYGDFTMGLSIPNPTGGNCPTFIIGGAGKEIAQLTTDAQVPGVHGITLFIVAGSTDPSSNAGTSAGTLWMLGGGSVNGAGGTAILQGGTSVNNRGGDLNLFGGNSTSGAAGNVYIAAGVGGQAGGNVKIYATNLGSQPGDISFWLGQPDIPHSVPLWTMSHTGALFPGNQGAGNAGDALVSAGNLASPSWGPIGAKISIPLTLSGATASTPTTSATLVSNGRQVTLTIGQVTALTTGPDDIILSTIPNPYRPSTLAYCLCGPLINASGFGYLGLAAVDTNGGITISLITPISGGTSVGALPGNWAALGGTQKGVGGGCTITYPL